MILVSRQQLKTVNQFKNLDSEKESKTEVQTNVVQTEKCSGKTEGLLERQEHQSQKRTKSSAFYLFSCIRGSPGLSQENFREGSKQWKSNASEDSLESPTRIT